jgi:Helix-turn-helix domain
MQNIIQISVKESLSELESLYTEASPFVKPRIRMLIVIKSAGEITRTVLASKAGVVYNSAVKWSNFYRVGGLDKLLEVKRGKYLLDRNIKPIFTEETLDAIAKEHSLKPFTSYIGLYKWMRENYNIKNYQNFLIQFHRHFSNKLFIHKYVNINIKESVSDLELIYEQCSPRTKPRIKMLIILKNEGIVSRTTLSQKVGAAYSSIATWHKIYQQNGLNTLLENKADSIINSKIHNVIKAKLSENTFHKFSELYDWIIDNQLPGIKYGTLHRYMRRHFNEELKMMKLLLAFPVKEAIEELDAKVENCHPCLKPRLLMLITLKANPEIGKLKLASVLNVTASTIGRWCKKYEEGGIEELIKDGRKG